MRLALLWKFRQSSVSALLYLYSTHTAGSMLACCCSDLACGCLFFTEPCSPPAWFSLRCGMDEDLLAGLKLVAALNTLARCHITPIIHLSCPSPSLWFMREHTCEGQILPSFRWLPSPILPSLANPLVSMDQDQCWLHWHLYFDRNQPTIQRHSVYRDGHGLFWAMSDCDSLTFWLTRCNNRNGRHECPLSLAVFLWSSWLPLRASACEGLWVMMWAGAHWTPGPQGQTPESEVWRSSLIKKSCSFSSCSPDSLVNDNIKHRQQNYVDAIARNGTSHFQLWIILQSWDVGSSYLHYIKSFARNSLLFRGVCLGCHHQSVVTSLINFHCLLCHLSCHLFTCTP